MRSYSFCWSSAATVVALGAASIAANAQDRRNQFPAPPNTLSFEETDCTLEQYRSGLMQVRTSKQELWLLKIVPQTTITVDGEAEAEYLRPGLTVQITGKVNRKEMLEEPISKIELLNQKGRPALGMFPAGEEGDNVRPVRNPGPGEYRIRGKVAAYKNGQLTIAIGGNRIAGTLADDVEIKFSSNDPALAGSGDKVKVKAWHYVNSKPIPQMNIPGKALAEDINIKLAKPLEASRKRSRR